MKPKHTEASLQHENKRRHEIELNTFCRAVDVSKSLQGRDFGNYEYFEELEGQLGYEIT